MGVRFFLLNLIFLLAFGAIGFNLYSLQVENSEYYHKRVQARSNYQKELKLRRGEIFFTDRNDNEIPTALNKDYPIVYAVPKEIDDTKETADKLSKIINKPKEEIIKDIDNPKSLFSLLINKASSEQIQLINKLKPDSIYIGSKQYRYYPFNNLASHVLGFVGVNENHSEPTGLYGIENEYNKKLKSGDEINLTIDRNVQVETEDTLVELVEEYEATGGSVIVQNPNTGAILAMANMPEFNPNEYSKSSVESFINPSVQYVYEPGSVFKPLTMAIGIDTGVITPDSTYYDKGTVTLNGETIHNWDHKSYGEITMTRVIERSINTGAVYAQEQIGDQRFINYLYKFGFESKTNIDLPNEVRGSLANITKSDARDIDFATASFGQGTAVTPIQLVNAYSAVANGGLLMRPYLNKDKDPYIRKRVIEEKTARQVANMMESAVRKAKIGSIPEFNISGKTGTAQIPDFKHGGYSDKYIHTFVGFAPTTAPQFVILIKLDKPNVDLAGRTVVPAFKELAQFMLNYYHIPPDNLPNE